MRVMSPALFALAYVLDWLVGDPVWLPHPVRRMGRMIRRGESLLRVFARGPRGELSDWLAQHRTLIRRCASFGGLGDAYTRLAVRPRRDNLRLAALIGTWLRLQRRGLS